MACWRSLSSSLASGEGWVGALGAWGWPAGGAVAGCCCWTQAPSRVSTVTQTRRGKTRWMDMG
ncbi:hypothetical protein D9M68_869740 [compost metagenome]